MKATSSANRPNHVHPSLEAQAAALWIFIQSKAPRFSLDNARDAVTRLGFLQNEDPKVVAKRLCTILKLYRVALKHTNALTAVSLLAGFPSWHENLDGAVQRLKFVSLYASQPTENEFCSWDELAAELRTWANLLHARGQLPLGVLTLNFTGNVLHLSTPVPPPKGDTTQRNEVWPLGIITCANSDPRWLEGALSAIEKLRRHLEESGRAVLDGFAVLRLCANSLDEPSHPMAVSVDDVVNSELVLMREDSEDDPHSACEIARGDELSCWYQLEQSIHGEHNEYGKAAMQISIPVEGCGAWIVDGARYTWALETLKPNAFVPGRVYRQLGIEDCERLLRRYCLAKRIHGGTFKHHEHVKRGDLYGVPPDSCRVDLHFALQELDRAGMTWESYCKKFASEPIPMTSELPIGFVFTLLENLGIEKPNRIFARPNLSEMVRVDDDGLLRALLPRVEHVRYIAPTELEEERKELLLHAIDEFANSLHTRIMLSSGAMQMEGELPHLVWASDAEQLLRTSETLGLTMYAATLPHLLPIDRHLSTAPGVQAWPWAIGNSLFLRFVQGKMK